MFSLSDRVIATPITVCLRLAGAFAKFQTSPLHRRHTIKSRFVTERTQSIKAVFIRKMDFLLWTGLFQQHSRAVAQVLNQGLHRFLSSSTQADAPP